MSNQINLGNVGTLLCWAAAMAVSCCITLGAISAGIGLLFPATGLTFLSPAVPAAVVGAIGGMFLGAAFMSASHGD